MVHHLLSRTVQRTYSFACDSGSESESESESESGDGDGIDNR
jgi:hypothetical protein